MAGTVNVHTLSPGMVFTDLLLDDSTPELRKFPFGVLAAQPEEVGEDLVPKILSVAGNGKAVEFLSTDKVLVKFYEKVCTSVCDIHLVQALKCISAGILCYSSSRAKSRST